MLFPELSPENPHKMSGAVHILVILGMARQEAEMGGLLEACGPASLADMAKLRPMKNPVSKMMEAT